MSEDTIEKMDANIKLAKLNNRSEYMDAAVEFYNGYLHNKNNQHFIGRTFIRAMQSMMDNLEKRLARIMFKQAVESAKLFWMTARAYNMNLSDADKIHNDCVREVKKINGAIRFPHKKDSENEIMEGFEYEEIDEIEDEE